MPAPPAHMEFAGQLSDLDAYYIEQRDLKVRNGRIHIELRRLATQPSTEDMVAGLHHELGQNQARIRTLSYLIDKTRLDCLMSCK